MIILPTRSVFPQHFSSRSAALQKVRPCYYNRPSSTCVIESGSYEFSTCVE